MPAAASARRDDLVHHPHVRVPGHHRFGDRVAGGRLGVLPGQVPRLARRAAQPHLLGLRRAGALPQLRERDMHRDMGVRARPVRHHLRADQQLTAGLQRVVEPLPLGPGILGAGLLAERLQHRLHGGGAFRGQVPADHARAAERGRGLHVPVVEPVLIAVRPRRAPLLQRDAGDHPQVIQRRPGLSGLHQDRDRLRAQLRRELPGPLGDRQRLRLGDIRVREGGGHGGVAAQQPHPPHLGPGVRAGHVGHRHQPRGRGAVPVAVVRVSGVEPGQHRRVRGGELRLDLAQRPQHRPARGGIQLARHPGRSGSPGPAFVIRSASATLPNIRPSAVHILNHLPGMP